MLKQFILASLLSLGLYAAPIQNDNAFQSAVTSIGKADKLVLMIYTTDDCPECAYMKKKVFHDPKVEGYLNTNYVIVEKNVHRDKLPDGYDYFGLPTMFFIDKNGVKKETVVGSRRAPEFAKELHRIRGMK